MKSDFNSRRLEQNTSRTSGRRGKVLLLPSAFFLLVFALLGCEPAQIFPEDAAYPLELPAGFPEMPIPADNQLTRTRVALGEKLFHDPILSRDRTISCESCHHQVNAFADPVAISPGIDNRLGFRNSQALINLAWHPTYFRDGGVRTLELQVLAPIMDHNEMDLTVIEAVERLRKIPAYVQMSQVAYGRQPDAFVITRAISAYERTLISGDAPYDRFEQGDSAALSPAARRGKDLFFSARTSCRNCHDGFNFTNFGFENNGLYAAYADSGRTRVTLDPSDRGKFGIPTLRNIAVTYPYMHDGSLETLEEVVEHYNSGGEAHPNKSPLIRPLGLNEGEKADLIAFLHALTDESFLTE